MSPESGDNPRKATPERVDDPGRRLFVFGIFAFLATAATLLRDIDVAEAQGRLKNQKTREGFISDLVRRQQEGVREIENVYGIKVEFRATGTERDGDRVTYDYAGLYNMAGRLEAVMLCARTLVEYPPKNVSGNFIPVNERLKKIFIVHRIQGRTTQGTHAVDGHADAELKEIVLGYLPRDRRNTNDWTQFEDRKTIHHEIGHLYFPDREMTEDRWRQLVTKKIGSYEIEDPAPEPEGLRYVGYDDPAINKAERPDGYARAYGQASHEEDIATVIEMLYDYSAEDWGHDLVLQAKLDVVKDEISRKLGYKDASDAVSYWRNVNVSATRDAEKQHLIRTRRARALHEHDAGDSVFIEDWRKFWNNSGPGPIARIPIDRDAAGGGGGG